LGRRPGLGVRSGFRAARRDAPRNVAESAAHLPVRTLNIRDEYSDFLLS
jgi:hypothetical protein